MDEQVNALERDYSLSVVLPGGLEKDATVHGSKPVMDLLVTLCASYHLNPSDYTVEVLSPNKNNISFKPNSPIGSLEAEKIVLKPKGTEEKIRRPYMPEASVRLLINYNKSHKAVVRVNPRVPLEMLLPVVCDKCEFQVETTVLLRDSQCKEPLDLSKTLNEHGLREVFAKDAAAGEHQQQPGTPEAAVTPTEVISPPPLQDLPKKKQKDITGILSLFRRRKNKSEMREAGSAPASPGCNKQVGVGVSSSSPLPTDTAKKRRAPQPPMGASQSVPNNLATCHAGGSQGSAESTLRRTKRRAPPPPCASPHRELQANTEVKDSLNTVEELRGSDESDSINLSLPSSSSPHPRSSSRPSFAHLHEVADAYLPSFGKDLCDARCALAKVLTSSVSKGTLVKRLRNSASFPKLYNGSFFTSAAQRGPDNGFHSAEPESVPTSNLPTEQEWEGPVQRKGTTTFKVVPSKTPRSHDLELTPDQITVEDHPEVPRNPTETEEDPCSPDGSETETPLQSPSSQEILASDMPASPPCLQGLDQQDSPDSPLPQVTVENQTEEPEVTCEVEPGTASDCSNGEATSDGQINSEDQTEGQSLSGQSDTADVDHCGSYTVEQEVGEDEEDCFPLPPPPVYFDENMEEERDDTTASSLPSTEPQTPTSKGPAAASGEDPHEPPSAVPKQSAAAPKLLDKMSSTPSRFAQAVALAVQRSRLRSGGRALVPQPSSSPQSTFPSPTKSTYQYGA